LSDLLRSGEVAVLLGHVVGQVDHAVGVAPLVVVPGDDLDEAWGQSNTGISIEDGGEWAGGEVSRDNGVLGVAQDSLKGSLRCLLNLGLDLVVAGVGAEADGEVNDGDVSGWDTEGHAGELAIQGWDNLSDGLGGTSGRWDNVVAGSASSTPVLASLGWAIDGELVDGDGMDSGHETLLNSPIVVENLGDWSQAVGGAGSVGDDIHVRGIPLVVHTDDEDWSVVLGWAGDDSLLGTALHVEASLLLVDENTSALADVVSTSLAPWDFGWVGLLEDVHLLAVDQDAAISFLDSSLEAS
jgi:hypothetical protein